jgi:DNA modification methylase
MAAERVGRRCFGIEIDPIYVDVIVRRWQAYSGETATDADAGRGFDEIEADRARSSVGGAE